MRILSATIEATSLLAVTACGGSETGVDQTFNSSPASFASGGNFSATTGTTSGGGFLTSSSTTDAGTNSGVTGERNGRETAGIVSVTHKIPGGFDYVELGAFEATE